MVGGTESLYDIDGLGSDVVQRRKRRVVSPPRSTTSKNVVQDTLEFTLEILRDLLLPPKT